jgi:hypothetical protein
MDLVNAFRYSAIQRISLLVSKDADETWPRCLIAPFYCLGTALRVKHAWHAPKALKTKAGLDGNHGRFESHLPQALHTSSI